MYVSCSTKQACHIIKKKRQQQSQNVTSFTNYTGESTKYKEGETSSYSMNQMTKFDTAHKKTFCHHSSWWCNEVCCKEPQSNYKKPTRKPELTNLQNNRKSQNERKKCQGLETIKMPQEYAPWDHELNPVPGETCCGKTGETVLFSWANSTAPTSSSWFWHIHLVVGVANIRGFGRVYEWVYYFLNYFEIENKKVSFLNTRHLKNEFKGQWNFAVRFHQRLAMCWTHSSNTLSSSHKATLYRTWFKFEPQ